MTNTKNWHGVTHACSDACVLFSLYGLFNKVSSMELILAKISALLKKKKKFFLKELRRDLICDVFFDFIFLYLSIRDEP